MVGRDQLEMQANRIEAVLASYGVAGQIWAGQVAPRFVRFQLVPERGTRVAEVERLSEEIALGLGVASARVYRQNGAIQVEIPRGQPGSVSLTSVLRQLNGVALPPATAALGLDGAGQPLLLRLGSPDVVHVLVSGTTGSGKTALARTMLISMATYLPQRALQLVLIDPKGGRGYAELAGLPHVLGGVITTAEEGARALAWAVAEMVRRDRERISEPAIVVAVDELADLVMAGGSEVEGALLRLAQRGREAGIHLVACTQKPAASVIDGVLKANFPVRLVGRVASKEDARVAAGISGTGAELLSGRGDFLLVRGGEQVRFQAALAGPEDLARLRRVND